MSDLDLDAVEARADAATDGPWFWRNAQGRSGAVYLQGARTRIVMAFKRMGMNGAQPMFRGLDGLLYESADVNINQFSDAAFIAHARTDVPALVAALREARTEVERMRTGEADSIAVLSVAWPTTTVPWIAETGVAACVSLLTSERDEARAAVARVRALHVPEWVVIDYVGGSVCRECREPVESEPCATIRALDGDPSTTTDGGV